MVGVSERSSHEGLLGTRSRELVLRVCGGPRDGHVVRLASTKCAVGSAENCTLRLRGAGLQPLHCLILRGAQQTVIRSWSRDTRLNGRAFDDATLAAGDRLSVGPLEFDVLETGSETDGVEQTADRLVASGTMGDLVPQTAPPAVDGGATLAEANRAEIARWRAELETEQAAFETRMQEQIAAFETQRATWESNNLEARCQRDAEQREEQRRQVESQLAEIATARADLDRQAEDAASQQQRANDFQQRLEQERADLQFRREEIDGQRQAQEALRAELDVQRSALESERSAAATDRAKLAREQEEFETRRKELNDSVARVEAERQELEARRTDFDRQANELEQARQQFLEQQQDRQGVDQIDELRAQYDADKLRLESELASLAERLSAAEQLADALRTEKETYEQKFSSAEEQLTEREQQLASHREQLGQNDERLALFEQQAGEQTQRHAELSDELAERDRRLAESAAELQALRDQLAEAQAQHGSDQQTQVESIKLALAEAAHKIEFEQAALETARRQWNEERIVEETRLREDQEKQHALESRLREERDILSDLRRELEDERKAIELLRGVLKPEVPTHAEEEELTVAQLLRDRQAEPKSGIESAVDVGDEVEFSPTKTEAPMSTSDLFERLGISANDEEEEDSLAARSPAGAGERTRHVSRPELPPVVPVATPAATEDREESIEEYMQKLLQRSRRAGDAPVSPVSYAPTPVVEEKPPVVKELTPAVPGSAEPSEIQRPVRPRPSAAETAVDLSGLREIANLSARGAIATFDRKKRKSAVIGSSTLALCTLTLGVVLLVLGRQEPTLHYCGLAGIVFGIFSMASATIATVRFRRAKRPGHTAPVVDAEVEAAEEAGTDAAPECIETVTSDEPQNAV